MEWLGHLIRNILERWGYLALAGGLLGESAGLPLPGETVLMYSSFVSHRSNHLNIFFVILVGSSAAILGDNLGYWIGKRVGPRLLRWLDKKFNMQDDITTAADLIRQHGGATIFWARYIFGLRTIAGPVAGTLNMEWKRFLLYNALGAVSWIVSISLTGFFFANKFTSLGSFIEKISWGVSAAVFVAGYLVWRKKKKDVQRSHT